MIYDMIFIYCSWVSTQWQWSIHLYWNMKVSNISIAWEVMYFPWTV